MPRFQPTGGPAFGVFNGATIQLAEDWTIDDAPEFFDVGTNLQGPGVDKRVKTILGKASFTPLAFRTGLVTLLTKLMPYTPAQIGNLIFPGTDLPFVVQTKSGVSLTYGAGAVSKMPSLQFTSDKMLIGSTEVSLLRKGGASGATAGDFVTVANSAYTEPSANLLDVDYDRYTFALGTAPSTPFDSLETEEDGITFEPTVNLSPITTSRDGIVNYRISDVGATVKFKPLNLTEAQYYAFLKMDGAGTTIGSSLGASSGLALSITGTSGGLSLTIPLAAPTKGGLRFSQKDGRIAEVTMQALRLSTSGTLQNLFTLGTVA